LGNDRQFHQFCMLLGRDDLASDPRFTVSSTRSEHRTALLPEIEAELAKWQSADLIAAMEAAKLPAGRVNSVPEALTLPQVAAREALQTLERDDGTPVRFLGFPGKFSVSPVNYRHAPPRSAQDSRAVLADALGMGDAEIEALLASGVVADRL
jgi:crotonobetainyl-CoA:carnitine CoA-transferase CaiB-like acyl-CoA transferase